MIAIDTSAIVAIILGEPEAETFMARLEAADQILIGTAVELEARIVLTNRIGATAIDEIGVIAGHPRCVRVDFEHAHLNAATDAFFRFGKGRHPASLNFGDCMSYAVAAVAGCPLLYKGQDFALTDIRSAL